MTFHLDENVDIAICRALRQRGIDATTSVDAGLLRSEDADQFAFARRSGRVLVSHDADMLRLAAATTDHAGIAYCRKTKYNGPRPIIRRLLHLAGGGAGSMRGRIEYL